MNWFSFVVLAVLLSVLGVNGVGYFTCTDKVNIVLKKDDGVISFTDIEQDTLFVANSLDSTSKCNPSVQSPSKVEFTFPIQDCEHVVTDAGDKTTYTFTVWNQHHYDNTVAIKRAKTFFFKITCSYENLIPPTTSPSLYDRSPWYVCEATGITIHMQASHFLAFKIKDPANQLLYVSDDLAVGSYDNAPPECKPSIATSTDVKFKFDYDQCQSEIQETDKHIKYKYILQNAGTPVSRTHEVQPFYCTFAKNIFTTETVGLAAQANSEIGQLTALSNLEMQISIPDGPPVANGQTIMSGTRLHVDVNLPDDEKTDQFVVSLQDCFATPTPNENDEQRVSFIDHSCPSEVSDMSPETLQVISNGESSTSSFEFESFEWKQLTVDQKQQLYITCLAEKCDQAQYTCTGNCLPKSSRLRRSYQQSTGAAKYVSAGPIFLASPRSSAITSCDKDNRCTDICKKLNNEERCFCYHGRHLLADGITCHDMHSSLTDLLGVGVFHYVLLFGAIIGVLLILLLLHKAFKTQDLSENLIIES